MGEKTNDCKINAVLQIGVHFRHALVLCNKVIIIIDIFVIKYDFFSERFLTTHYYNFISIFSCWAALPKYISKYNEMSTKAEFCYKFWILLLRVIRGLTLPKNVIIHVIHKI